MGNIFLMVGIRIKIQTCILRAGKISAVASTCRLHQRPRVSFLLFRLSDLQPTIILAPGDLMLCSGLCLHFPTYLGHTIIPTYT